MVRALVGDSTITSLRGVVVAAMYSFRLFSRARFQAQRILLRSDVCTM